MRNPSIVLVIGGAASGKSAWAEGFVRASGLAKVYVATAQALDDEMAEKIARHRRARMGQGWRTVEAAKHLPHRLAEIEAEEIALVDCATFWLSHEIGGSKPWHDSLDEVIEVMRECPAPVVVVSNELGQGIVPVDPATRAFRQAHGEMNQDLASAADLVVLVVAGLPMVLKGTLPW